MSNSNDGMDYVSKKSADLIDTFNAEGIKAALAVVMPDGRLVTRRTDHYKNVFEFLGLWEAAKFQESVAMWNLKSKISERSGSRLEEPTMVGEQ